jgi:hypothetical protein
MKKESTLLFVLIFFTSLLYAQVPQAIPYQAAARNAQGQVLANQNIRVRFTLTDSLAAGTVLYKETHQTTTNALGIFNLNLGTGTIVSGNMANIVWSKNSKFLKVELDATGSGNSYTDLGTQQLLSVPYAQYAAKAGNGFTHYIGEYFGGGVIFHLWKDSLGVEHGLVVSKNEQSQGASWSNITNTQIGTTAQSSWDGLGNSIAIVNQSGHSNSAAKICLDLISLSQNDWYLPSIDELNLMWNNRFNINKSLSMVPGSDILKIKGYFWSSSERSAEMAWYFYFDTGESFDTLKTETYIIRSIRAF